MSLTRGSLASVVDCHHLWKRLQKDGNAVESSWFVVDCVLERPIVFPECSIHVNFFGNLVLFCEGALYPGGIGVHVFLLVLE